MPILVDQAVQTTGLSTEVSNSFPNPKLLSDRPLKGTPLLSGVMGKPLLTSVDRPVPDAGSAGVPVWLQRSELRELVRPQCGHQTQDLGFIIFRRGIRCPNE